LKALALAVAFAAAGVACKRQDDCAKAIDHVAHLSWQETQKSLPEIAPNIRPEVAKMLPTEQQILPTLREVISKRFGARCREPAFAKCVLAAADSFAVARCEHPE
jgi:hypothetical protein